MKIYGGYDGGLSISLELRLIYMLHEENHHDIWISYQIFKGT